MAQFFTNNPLVLKKHLAGGISPVDTHTQKIVTFQYK